MLLDGSLRDGVQHEAAAFSRPVQSGFTQFSSMGVFALQTFSSSPLLVDHIFLSTVRDGIRRDL
jgi:hypothetical protein